MKRFLLATVSMVALTSVTRAADMPAAMPAKGPIYSSIPVATWDGFYVGVQGGVARRDTQFTEVTPVGIFHFEDRKSGGAVGALLGFNLQRGNFVYGVEGDWSWLNVKTSQNTTEFIGSFNARWLATVRGRIGLAFDTALFYATGGVAFGNVQNRVPLNFDVTGTVFSAFIQDQTKTGWTAGAGVEYMLSPHWTARAEFRYVDLGKTSVNCKLTGDVPDACGVAGATYRGEFSNALKLGLVGVAYKF